jgi:toxin ParE1/3/4
VTASSRVWRVVVSARARADTADIFDWTSSRFGEAQAFAYLDTLSAAIESLYIGPTVIGVKARGDIAKGLFTLHVARLGRKGRHLVAFRIGRNKDQNVIEVLRLLHDSMDLERHLPSPEEPE